MKTHAFIAALAAVTVTIALGACDGSTNSAPSGTPQDPTTTVSSTTTVARSTTLHSTTSTTVAPRGSAEHSRTTSTTAVTTTATTVPRPTAVVDGLVALHGARLHLHCQGAGPTTVMLIAGFGGSTDSWGSIGPTVAQTSRVCAYDRFGNGASDAPPAAQTFATQAADLHALLESAGEPGPYVVVGHSFGGAEAVTFASMFPSEVRGLLLVDTSPPTWNTAICAVPDDGSDAAHIFRDLCAQQSTPDNNVEHLDAPTAFAEVAAIDSLNELPTIVVTADHHSYTGLAASEEARLNNVWNDGQAHWVSLASASQLVTVDNTGHNIQLDRPDVVLDKIHDLLQ